MLQKNASMSNSEPQRALRNDTALATGLVACVPYVSPVALAAYLAAAALVCVEAAHAQSADAALKSAAGYEATAAEEATAGKKRAALEEATAVLERFLSSHPQDQQASDVRYKQAQLLTRRGDLVAEAIEWADAAQERQKLAAQATRLYDAARAEATRAAEGFKTMEEDAHRLHKGKKPQKNPAADRARARMLEALLLAPWITYSSAKVHVGTPDYAKTVSQAAEQYLAFAKEHPRLGYTLQAHREAGLCYFRIKHYDQALRCYRRVIRTRPIAATDEIRQLTYYNQAQCLNACGRHQDAIRAVSNMLSLEWPELLEEQVAVALAAKLEEAKALVALAKQSRSRAVELQQKGDQAGSAKEKADTKRRLAAAAESARLVQDAGGTYAQTATNLLAGWAGLLGQGGERTADTAFAQAEAQYNTQQFASAVPLYKEAVDLAQLPQQEPRAIQAWFKLGACHAKLRQPLEAARCFGYVPRNFGKSPSASKAAYISLCLYGQVYEQEKSREAALNYLDAAQFLVGNYPSHPKAAAVQGVVQSLKAALE